MRVLFFFGGHFANPFLVLGDQFLDLDSGTTEDDPPTPLQRELLFPSFFRLLSFLFSPSCC